MADDEDPQYNNSHRAFLQAFLARSTLTLDEAKPILAAILTAHERKETLTEDVTEADFNSFVSAANARISPYDLEIRSAYHQITRKRIYALVNSTSDPIMQLATVNTADEIGFLKRVLDAMFEKYNTIRQELCAIKGMDAMKLAKPPAEDRRETQNGSTTQGSSGQGLTQGQTEKMLQSLVEEGWFELSQKGYYSLSPRALMELRGWLLETYNTMDSDDDSEVENRVNKVKVCVACKEILTTGQRCSRKECPCRLHDICTQNFFRVQKSTKCPLCKKEWRGDTFVGERALVNTDSTRRKEKGEKRRSGPSQRRQSPSATQGSDDATPREGGPDGGEAEEEDEDT